MNPDAVSGLNESQGFTDLQLAELSADPDAILGLLETIKSLQAETKMLTWALGVIVKTAEFYEKHLKEILCASDEVAAEDLQAHAGAALEEADWTDEEIAKARAVLSPEVSA